MDDFKSMRLFLSVVKTGSLSAAGRQAGLSPASVSRQITSLENDLGVRLLNRTSRRLSLTEAGQVYLDRAEHLLHDVEELRDAVSQHAVKPRGTLRILSRISLGTQHVSPLIPSFREQYPDLKIDLWLTDNDLDLAEHGIDLALRTGNLADSMLIGRLLASSPRVICASPEYWRQHNKPLKPEDLKKHNCLTYRFEFGTAAALWQFKNSKGRKIDIPVTSDFQTNNGEALRIAALSGLGVALLPAWSVREHLLAGTLERALYDYETTVSNLDNGIYAVYLSRRNLPIKTRLFIDHLISEFGKQTWS